MPRRAPLASTRWAVLWALHVQVGAHVGFDGPGPRAFWWTRAGVALVLRLALCETNKHRW
jgi:hypothetical protein